MIVSLEAQGTNAYNHYAIQSEFLGIINFFGGYYKHNLFIFGYYKYNLFIKRTSFKTESIHLICCRRLFVNGISTFLSAYLMPKPSF